MMAKKGKASGFRLLMQISESKAFQKNFSLSRAATVDLLRKEGWREIFAELEAKPIKINCASLLKYCQKTIDQLSPTPKEGWLEFARQYAINLSYPDQGFISRSAAYADGALFYLAVLQAYIAYAKIEEQLPENLNFHLLEESEYSDTEYLNEYKSIINSYQSCFVYEMMLLSQELTPYQTLEHIVGVHNLALSLGRQMKAANAPVDLALLSGAAAIHDLGKFGCKEGERVPYLHYYYTNQWGRAFKAPSISHLAANHSAWDLELENLSVESLLLIYADFRVKQLMDAKGQEHTELYSLVDSFAVILDKLDDVDREKRQRYSFVYAKLHDFEDYMRSLGIDVDQDNSGQIANPPDISLMSPPQIVEAFKFTGIAHNIALMHRLDTERLFGNILEVARSEKDWKNLRAYIDIIEEYFTYLGVNQKINTLEFLYELLIHREGDIRRSAAALIGNIIAHFDDGYKKELPAGVLADDGEPNSMMMWKKYLRRFIVPDHKLTEQHKSWIGYVLKIMAASALEECPPKEKRAYLTEIMSYFEHSTKLNKRTSFVLLDTFNYLPLEICDDSHLQKLYQFATNAANRSTYDLRTAGLRIIRRIAESGKLNSQEAKKEFKQFVLSLEESNLPSFVFHKSILRDLAGLDNSAQLEFLQKNETISEIYLENLKMATSWIVKSVNVHLLQDIVDRGHPDQLLHIAAHFSNLLKVSERVVVRHDAGQALVKIAPLLEPHQRNEIAMELVKGLEVGEYAFSKYIPIYLGEFALWLNPQELDELISRLNVLLSNASDNIVAVSLDTIGILLECYNVYRQRFNEDTTVFQSREKRLLGMLLKGLSSYRPAVQQEALLIIGNDLFASKRLSDADKRHIFSLCYKKLLFLIAENDKGALTFYYRSAALNHIYRFIAIEEHNKIDFIFEKHQKLAFFPGTFDPFTLSHKGIVKEIADMGFEIMLAIDEFSWSKNVQARKIRRQIAVMSLADDLNVHIFPESIPINIANPRDLETLHAIFPEQNLYVVVGSDVILNASSYRKPVEPDSIHHANHIIIRRNKTEEELAAETKNFLSCIDGDIINISLPSNLADISSTKIRENIDNNRDISNLIDKSAQEYIYNNSLYLREPQYKPVLKVKDISFDIENDLQPTHLNNLLKKMLYKNEDAKLISEAIATSRENIITLRPNNANKIVEGFIAYRDLAGCKLLDEMRSVELAQAVRKRAAGKLFLISGIYTKDTTMGNPEQLLLTEALNIALRNDCTYAVFHQPYGLPMENKVAAVLKRQGFIEISTANSEEKVYLTDMRSPITLMQNLETTIKEPLASNEKVLAAIDQAHKRLQTSLAAIYPGNLVLSMSTSVIHQRLINKITQMNQVPVQPTEPRVFGENMCVPFGKILRGKVVPNTITKTLHTDKVFEPDIGSWNIEAYPFYSSLEDQIRTIKSFNLPVILVDDILHSADRLRTLNPIFEEQGIDISRIMVGVMSGRGKDLITTMNRDADSIYYIPNLRSWFVESSMYPFIGGDTVRREGRQVANLLPSVNLILPYASPPLRDYSSRESILDFSLTCLKNSRDILLALESEYLSTFGRNLTLNRLSEAIILPLCPDKGECMAYDPALNASVYLNNEIEMLLRSRRMLV